MNANLTLVQVNDVHGYLDLHPEIFWQGSQAVYRQTGGYARIAALLKQIRSENPGRVLFCDNGDTLHGTYPAVKTLGAALVPILNTLGLDAGTVHWEFAYTPKVLQERAAALTYPLLAINIFVKETGALFLPPYTIKEINGLRLGIIGIASNIIAETMPPAFSEGLVFTLGREELPPIVEKLRTQERVDLIVLISHLGFPQDMKLLAEVSGIDICLSGHTHNRLYQPILQGNTLIVQSGYHGSFITRLDLEVSGRRILNYRHRLIEVAQSIQPDPSLEILVQEALSPFADELSQVVGETATALHRATSLESSMDNFLLQAVQEATGAELAFSNGWRYGAPVLPGPVTLNDLYNITPMNPSISTVELTGTEILAMLEENLERTFSSDPFKQMGGYVKRCLGLNAYIRIENPPGQRLQKIFAGQEEIQLNKAYTAAFVTEQGIPQKYGRHRQDTPYKSVEAMRAYLSTHRPLHAEWRGTFTVV
ncbi:MAG: bifunctional metallophosphatase/5'-nucleotidase [Desulfitobacteriaceae bacterium]